MRGNYLPDLGRWGSSDPAAATYESYSNYHFGGNNPLRNFELDGASFYSTHTDWSGNVVAVYDDGDLGVYRHMDASRAIIDMNHNYSTSAGGQYMGESLHTYSFVDHNVYNMSFGKELIGVGKIDFESTWAYDQVDRILQQSPTAFKYAMNARGGYDWDLKTKSPEWKTDLWFYNRIWKKSY